MVIMTGRRRSTEPSTAAFDDVLVAGRLHATSAGAGLVDELNHDDAGFDCGVGRPMTGTDVLARGGVERLIAIGFRVLDEV